MSGRNTTRIPHLGYDFDSDFADPQTAKANNLYHFYDVTVYPVMTYKEPPVYPEEALEKGISGRVVLTVTINEEGKVEQEEVYKSGTDPDPLLAKAALTAVYKCKFRPAMVDGNPIKVKMKIPYHFQLR